MSKIPPVPSDKAALDTRELIMSTAEMLFIEQGYAESSLRQITQRAGVNLAAVNYHFGSKEVLLEEILKRHLSRLNQERMEAITQLRQAAGDAPIRPSLIMVGFFGSLIKHAKDRPSDTVFLRLLGRVYSNPNDFIRVLFNVEHEEVLQVYLEELYRALPTVSKTEILWRLDFMLGAMAYAIAGTDALQLVSNWNQDTTETESEEWERLYDRLMSFLMGGFRAPLPTHDERPALAPTS